MHNVYCKKDYSRVPYGVYLCRNGDRYLFNREYQPFLKYSILTCLVEEVDLGYWVSDIDSKQWFWKDEDLLNNWVKVWDDLNSVVLLWENGYPYTPREFGMVSHERRSKNALSIV